jgi:uncharacterized protein (TIGR02453 family)
VAASPSRFTGFPDDALAFFAELTAHNERAWWQANKDRFESSVRDPMRALLDELEPEWGTLVPFRMNRDTRFSKDKSPYKTAHAAMGETEGGSSHYVQLSAAGLFVGAGMYHLARDQLVRFREAVDDDPTAAGLESAVAAVRRAGLEVTGGASQLATAPRGWPRDHPRIELLRWTGAISNRDFGAPAWLGTRRPVSEVSKVWARSAPLVDWLDRHVGPSEIPPR